MRFFTDDPSLAEVKGGDPFISGKGFELYLKQMGIILGDGLNFPLPALEAESIQTIAGLGALGELFSLMKNLGIEDESTFAILNVFGRPLKEKRIAGRDHRQLHNCLTMIGKNVRPGVVGGLAGVA